MLVPSWPVDSIIDDYVEVIDISSRLTIAGLFREAIDETGAAFSCLFSGLHASSIQHLPSFCEKFPLSLKPPRRLSRGEQKEGDRDVAEARRLIQEGGFDEASSLLRPWNESNSIVKGLHEADSLLLFSKNLYDFAFTQACREIFFFPEDEKAKVLLEMIFRHMAEISTPLHQIMSQKTGIQLAAIRAHALLHDSYFEYADIVARTILFHSPGEKVSQNIVTGLERWHPCRCYHVREYLREYPDDGEVMHEEIRTCGNCRKGYGIFLLKEAKIEGAKPVVTVRGRILEESAPSGAHLGAIPLLIDSEEAPVSRMIEECVPLVSPTAHTFWHWFIEQLPRLLIAEKSGYTGKYLVPSGRPFVIESLTMLNIPEERLIFFENNSSLSVQRLFLVETPSKPDFHFVPEVYTELRDRLLKNVAPRGKRRRTYVTRSGTRGVMREEDLLRMIEPFEFEVHDFENISFQRQVEIAASSEVFMGPHGAAFAHTLLLPPGAHVVELFSPNYVNTGMAPLHGILGNSYHMIVASNQARHYKYGDQIVPPLDVIALVLDNVIKAISSSRKDVSATT